MSTNPAIIPFNHAVKVCRLGEGSWCCSFLLGGPEGFECAKGTTAEVVIKQRRDAGTFVAMGDNCKGWLADAN